TDDGAGEIATAQGTIVRFRHGRHGSSPLFEVVLVPSPTRKGGTGVVRRSASRVHRAGVLFPRQPYPRSDPPATGERAQGCQAPDPLNGYASRHRAVLHGEVRRATPMDSTIRG